MIKIAAFLAIVAFAAADGNCATNNRAFTYTATLENRSRQSAIFSIAGVDWKCKAKACQGNVIVGQAPFAACSNLVVLQGRVTRFDGLNGKLLEACNRITS